MSVPLGFSMERRINARALVSRLQDINKTRKVIGIVVALYYLYSYNCHQNVIITRHNGQLVV